jgi:hypothetical protein
VAPAQIDEPRRPQQAADVLRAEWRMLRQWSSRPWPAVSLPDSWLLQRGVPARDLGLVMIIRSAAAGAYATAN